MINLFQVAGCYWVAPHSPLAGGDRVYPLGGTRRRKNESPVRLVQAIHRHRQAGSPQRRAVPGPVAVPAVAGQLGSCARMNGFRLERIKTGMTLTKTIVQLPVWHPGAGLQH
jgi:hypothetical protein